MSKRKKKKTSPVPLIILAVILFGSVMGGGGYAVANGMIAFFIVCIVLGVSLGVFLAIWNSPTMKGKRGEWKVARILKKAVGDDGFVINDVIVPGENGRTSQIDHIAFTKDGVHIVETKNYAGRIYGSENQLEWTQVLAYGHRKNKLYNPLKQNATHYFNIVGLLGDKKGVFTYTVFVRGNTDYIESGRVYSPKELKNAIKDSKGTLTPEEVKRAYDLIVAYKEKPLQTNKEHVKEIKETQKNIENNICPRCGSSLVLRKSKDGKSFYGCSGYPKCKFTKKA